MRRMYSENQLAKIIADNVSPLIKDAPFLLKGNLLLDDDTILATTAFYAPFVSAGESDWSGFEIGDGDNLQDALDAKSDKLYYHNITLTDESAENSIGIQLLTRDSTAYTKEQALEHLASFTGKNTEVFYYYNSTTDVVYTDGFITNIRYTGGASPSLSVGGYALNENNTLVRFSGLAPDINNLINFTDTVVPL